MRGVIGQAGIGRGGKEGTATAEESSGDLFGGIPMVLEAVANGIYYGG